MTWLSSGGDPLPQVGIAARHNHRQIGRVLLDVFRDLEAVGRRQVPIAVAFQQIDRFAAAALHRDGNCPANRRIILEDENVMC